jgi:hypothetical protein
MLISFNVQCPHCRKVTPWVWGNFGDRGRPKSADEDVCFSCGKTITIEHIGGRDQVLKLYAEEQKRIEDDLARTFGPLKDRCRHFQKKDVGGVKQCVECGTTIPANCTHPRARRKLGRNIEFCMDCGHLTAHA